MFISEFESLRMRHFVYNNICLAVVVAIFNIVVCVTVHESVVWKLSNWFTYTLILYSMVFVPISKRSNGYFLSKLSDFSRFTTQKFTLTISSLSTIVSIRILLYKRPQANICTFGTGSMCISLIFCLMFLFFFSTYEYNKMWISPVFL